MQRKQEFVAIPVIHVNSIYVYFDVGLVWDMPPNLKWKLYRWNPLVSGDCFTTLLFKYFFEDTCGKVRVGPVNINRQCYISSYRTAELASLLYSYKYYVMGKDMLNIVLLSPLACVSRYTSLNDLDDINR